MLEEELKQLGDNDSDSEHMKKLRNELDELYSLNAKGAQIRSRAKYIEEGEQNSKFFLGLEKSRQKSNIINCLSVGENDVTKDEDILDAAAKFYDELYKSKCISDNIIDECMNDVDIMSTLTKEESNTLDGKILYQECESVVKKLAPNKSPGLDGISNEFYKTFRSDIGKLIVDSFNESYEKRELTESQRTAVIALLYKKGDAKLLKNYRPISLTNSDYKILAFCLANRLQSVIKNIIHPSQVSYNMMDRLSL